MVAVQTRWAIRPAPRISRKSGGVQDPDRRFNPNSVLHQTRATPLTDRPHGLVLITRTLLVYPWLSLTKSKKTAESCRRTGETLGKLGKTAARLAFWLQLGADPETPNLPKHAGFWVFRLVSAYLITELLTFWKQNQALTKPPGLCHICAKIIGPKFHNRHQFRKIRLTFAG